MRFLTSKDCSRISKPATVAVPPDGVRKQVSIRIVVVLPAPLGPRKPTSCPFCTSKEIWSTAVLCAYLFVSPLTVIIGILSVLLAVEMFAWCAHFLCCQGRQL